MLGKIIFHRKPDSGTGRSWKSAEAVALVMMVLLSMSLSAAFAQKPESPNAAADLPVGPMQAKAIASCEECHEGRIIVQQRLSKAAWTKEVDKMIKWGAVVDAGDHDPLIDYFSANFGVDQAPYEPARTSRNTAHLSKRK